MKFIADFHLHSKYSRATSKNMDLENLDKWARVKGIKVLGTGDFTHPAWFKELKEKLEPAEPGLYKLKSEIQQAAISRGLASSTITQGAGQNSIWLHWPALAKSETRFILTVEISCIYSKKGRVRKIHLIIFAPSLEVAEKINNQLSWRGNLKADGRPILGLDAEELVKILININPEIVIIPAHCWTPWFSVFGSMSGFDSLEECFGEQTKYIFAIETGLSSNPQMNWRLSKLDQVAIISNSDSHSLQKIGREANVFDCQLSYSGIIDAIKSSIPVSSKRELPSQNKFLETIEFFPEEGKYHYDGHRLCGVSFSPSESKKYNNLCPCCRKPLTIGVLNRVEQLADRPSDYQDPRRLPYQSLIPLDEIIAESLGLGDNTKAVHLQYENLIRAFNSEFNVLLEASVSDIAQVSSSEIAEAIARVREGRVTIRPGYDGVYGKISIFSPTDQENISKQKTLF